MRIGVIARISQGWLGVIDQNAASVSAVLGTGRIECGGEQEKLGGCGKEEEERCR